MAALSPPMHPAPLKISGAAQRNFESPASAREVRLLLCELQELLDAYGPSWYTERHHRKIAASVAFMRRVEGDTGNRSLPGAPPLRNRRSAAGHSSSKTDSRPRVP